MGNFLTAAWKHWWKCINEYCQGASSMQTAWQHGKHIQTLHTKTCQPSVINISSCFRNKQQVCKMSAEVLSALRCMWDCSGMLVFMLLGPCTWERRSCTWCGAVLAASEVTAQRSGISLTILWQCCPFTISVGWQEVHLAPKKSWSNSC